MEASRKVGEMGPLFAWRLEAKSRRWWIRKSIHQDCLPTLLEVMIKPNKGSGSRGSNPLLRLRTTEGSPWPKTSLSIAH